eukprot:22456-Hanusia_phi.AAC.1
MIKSSGMKAVFKTGKSSPRKATPSFCFVMCCVRVMFWSAVTFEFRSTEELGDNERNHVQPCPSGNGRVQAEGFDAHLADIFPLKAGLSAKCPRKRSAGR